MNPEEYAQLFRLGEKHWWFIGTRDILFSSIGGRPLINESILDAGCGSGLMMKRFTEAGRVFGIDYNRGAVDHCRSLGFSRLCQADAVSLPFKSGVFGLVVAADLLEHCEDDVAMLREAFRVTAYRGTLLVSVPAYMKLWSAHDAALHHKRRYSKRDLSRKVESAGFRVKRISYFNTLLFGPVALERLTMERIRKASPDYRIKYHEDRRLLNQLLLRAMRVERRLLGRFNLPFGLSLFLLASRE